MILKLYLRNNKIKLVLEKDKKVIDQKEWGDENNLSDFLLKEIDKMLKKNKITQKQNFPVMQLSNPESVGYTTKRIAEATAKAWNWGRG